VFIGLRAKRLFQSSTTLLILNDWNEKQAEAYRILNASFHNLTVLTYDHVLARARRINGIGD